MNSLRIGNYELVCELGPSPVGVVYHGLAPDRGQPVTVTMVTPSQAGFTPSREHFDWWCQSAVELVHPNLVRVYDIVLDHDRLAVVGEPVDGVCLQRKTQYGLLGLGQTLDVVEQLAQGLAALHQHDIVHQYLDPLSVYVSPDSGPQCNRVQITIGAVASMSGGPPGPGVTPSPYCAPELAARRSAVWPSVDVFSLGSIFFELLVGRSTLGGDAANDIRTQLLEADLAGADELGHLIISMMHPDPAVRPDIGEVLQVLQRSKPELVETAVAEPRSGRLPPTHTSGFSSPPPYESESHSRSAQPVPVPIVAGNNYGDKAFLPANQESRERHQFEQYEYQEPQTSGLSAGYRMGLAVGVLLLVLIGAIIAVNQPTDSSSATSGEPSTSSSSTTQAPFDDPASPVVVSSQTTEAIPEVQTCCWTTDFEPSQIGIGVDVKVAFSSSRCSAVRWIGPEGVEYSSPGWPDASKGCWEDHERTFTALAAGETHTVQVEVVDMDGHTGEAEHSFVPPEEMANMGGPTVINWNAAVTDTSAKVTFRASTCTNSIWTGPNGEALPSLGWPDATVRCWTDHGHEFTNLAPATTYTISVDLRDTEARSGHDEFSFTTSG